MEKSTSSTSGAVKRRIGSGIVTIGCCAERIVHRANKGSSEESAIKQVDVCVGARLFRVSKTGRQYQR